MLASFCKMAKVDAHCKSIFNCLKDILSVAQSFCPFGIKMIFLLKTKFSW